MPKKIKIVEINNNLNPSDDEIEKKTPIPPIPPTPPPSSPAVPVPNCQKKPSLPNFQRISSLKRNSRLNQR
jgi:hypothetical protein